MELLNILEPKLRIFRMYSRHIFAEFGILLRGIASNKNESINSKVNETIKNMLELDTREGASRMIIKFVKFNLEIKKRRSKE